MSALLVLSACASAHPPPAGTVASLGAPAGTVTGAAAGKPTPASRMAPIPEATFWMGSAVGEPDERPVHASHVAAFEMDVTEVTVAEYAGCARARACVPAPQVVKWPGVTSAEQRVDDVECNGDRPERQDYAVNCVDWSMADAYCRWAGKRLPTEDEWEYAACGGNCDALKDHEGRSIAWVFAHGPGASRVAGASPSPFGLYDMAGNVWEWTASTYCPYDHPGCADPRRVVRGGSWSIVDYLSVRLSDRSPTDPSTRNINLGFRCARG